VSENSFVRFTQNPTYWGRTLTQAEIQANPYLDPGHVKNVEIFAKTDDLARYVDLSTGTVQVAGIESQDWNFVLNNPAKYSYAVIPNNSMLFVAIALTSLFDTQNQNSGGCTTMLPFLSSAFHVYPFLKILPLVR
jgi:hypothetical protein